MSYYFTIDKKKVQGPASLEQLSAYVRAKKLPATVLVCPAGSQEWKPINSLVPLIQLTARDAAMEPAPSLSAQAPPAAQAQAQTAPAQSALAQAASAQSARAQAAVAQAAVQSAPAPLADARSVVRPMQVEARSEATALAIRSDFRELSIASHRSVDVKQHIAPGTRLHKIVGFMVWGMVGLLGGLYIAIVTFGLGLLVAGIFYWLNLRRGHARIHGGSVHVNPEQFPEIHQCTEEFAKRLGMKTPPNVYVVEGSVLNAFAAKLGKRKYVLLLDDIVYGCLLAGETKALSFIIGHEMAHHALGHTGFFRSSLSSIYKPLSRCDEMSCDSVAADLVEDKDLCARGLGILLIGPQLVGKLNWQALDRQASELLARKTWKGAESSMSHPLLLRRYAALRGL